jgi:hypothetical protein
VFDIEKNSRSVNWPNSVGILPASRILPSKLRERSLVSRYKSCGIVFEKSLLLRSSSLREVARPSSGEIGPAQSLLSSLKTSRFLANPTLRGIEPWNRFDDNEKCRSIGSIKNSPGIVPVMLFLPKLRFWIAVRRLNSQGIFWRRKSRDV